MKDITIQHTYKPSAKDTSCRYLFINSNDEYTFTNDLVSLLHLDGDLFELNAYLSKDSKTLEYRWELT